MSTSNAYTDEMRLLARADGLRVSIERGTARPEDEAEYAAVLDAIDALMNERLAPMPVAA